MASFLVVLKTPFSPKVTSFKSLSFPTHVKIKSAPLAAFAGVSALDPLNSATHLLAFAPVRL